MDTWLGKLAAGFVCAAAGFSSYLALESAHGQKVMSDAAALRPVVTQAIDTAVLDGHEALQTLIQTALAAPETAEPQIKDAVALATAEQTKAQLPFRVVGTTSHSAAGALKPEFENALATTMEAAIAGGTNQLVAPHALITPDAIAAADLSAATLTNLRDEFQAVEQAARVAKARAGDLKLADGVPGTERAEIHPVEARLLARISPELRKYFDLYLYVSKAENGEWAQRMYVMAKQPDERLAVVHKWMVSTGKEEVMVNPHGVAMDTDTPEGFFRLDRSRFFADYTSRQWKAPMPHAMFFDWQTEGRVSGLAIHGTGPAEDIDLGRRASKGCIRLSPENAKVLYKLITENYGGRVPQLKIDPNTGTQSTNGLMRRDTKGRILTKLGYRVLVVIENYGGPSTDTIATIM
ncbi:MAG TPA: hypothetical protein DCL54_01860 [Alphaproteobacteria bacterium]|nr:hypothetical protein [Alphaproteobacteria bacterium]HAJ45309.1 hypothetical protein [Alphaproteobacteria bacterium]